MIFQAIIVNIMKIKFKGNKIKSLLKQYNPNGIKNVKVYEKINKR